jgi:hypothetical protein
LSNTSHDEDDAPEDVREETGLPNSVQAEVNRLSNRELDLLIEFGRAERASRMTRGTWLTLVLVPVTILVAALIYMVLRPPTTQDRDEHVRKTSPARADTRSAPQIVSDADAPETTVAGSCGEGERDVYVGSVVSIDQERMSATLEFSRCDGAPLDLDLRYWIGVGPDRPERGDLPIYVVRSAGRFADERVTRLDGGTRVRLTQVDIWPTPRSFVSDPCGAAKHLFLMTSSAETTARHLYQHDSLSFIKECAANSESANQSDPDVDELEERATRQASEDGAQVASAVVARGMLVSQAIPPRRLPPADRSTKTNAPSTPRWRNLRPAQADEIANRAAEKLMSGGDFEGALAECEDVRSMRCLFMTGMAHERAGRKTQACQAFERARLLDQRDGGTRERVLLEKQDELGCTDDDLRGVSF